MLKIGDVAPLFEAEASGGRQVKLSEYAGKKNVVLFFYPKDNTPGCTAEACTFRDNYTAFVDAGAEVVGVSSDSAASHDGFASKHQLPMTLLSDEDGKVRALYGVRPTLGIMPGRATFVIDRSGTIVHTFTSQLRVKTHVEQALAVVKGLERPEAVPARPQP